MIPDIMSNLYSLHRAEVSCSMNNMSRTAEESLQYLEDTREVAA